VVLVALATPIGPVWSAAEDAWETTDTANATFQAAPAADVRVYADRTRLLNVFENVFRNSVEHGGPDVAIRLVGPPKLRRP